MPSERLRGLRDMIASLVIQCPNDWVNGHCLLWLQKVGFHHVAYLQYNLYHERRRVRYHLHCTTLLVWVMARLILPLMPSLQLSQSQAVVEYIQSEDPNTQNQCSNNLNLHEACGRISITRQSRVYGRSSSIWLCTLYTRIAISTVTYRHIHSFD